MQRRREAQQYHGNSKALAFMQVLFSRSALASSLGKNVYDTTRLCKALKLRIVTNACGEQCPERVRYVQATRK